MAKGAQKRNRGRLKKHHRDCKKLAKRVGWERIVMQAQPSGHMIMTGQLNGRDVRVVLCGTPDGQHSVAADRRSVARAE